ncbi:MAG: hypothetical protein ACTSRG_01565 [Candidatus Helarchaeota archaeon]
MGSERKLNDMVSYYDRITFDFPLDSVDSYGKYPYNLEDLLYPNLEEISKVESSDLFKNEDEGEGFLLIQVCQSAKQMVFKASKYSIFQEFNFYNERIFL